MMSMARSKRPQITAWTESVRRAGEALQQPAAREARLRARLRHTAFSLTNALEMLTVLFEQIDVAREQVRAHEGRLAGILAHVPCPYVITTPDAAVLEVNPAATQILNMSARGLLGRNLLLYFDDRDTWARQLAEVSASGTAARRAAVLRPRERVAEHVTTHVSVLPFNPDVLQWFIVPGYTEASRCEAS